MSLTLAPNAITFADLTVLSPTTIKWNIFSAATNLLSNNKYLSDTTSTALTATLPPLPQNGDSITIADGFGTWAVRNLTVRRNGKLINNLAEDLICDINSAKTELVYNNATNSWRVTLN
jgi:hypothetical protein